MDAPDSDRILTINAGSSSIKLALFELRAAPEKVSEGTITDIGQPQAKFVAHGSTEAGNLSKLVTAPDHAAAATILMHWLKEDMAGASVRAVGHRIVHGGPNYSESCVITDQVLSDLRKLTLFDPEHLPVEIGLVEAMQRSLPEAAQVACFDTAFHNNLPSVAQLLPIPRRYRALGLRRYGFHGLSYSHLMEELGRLDGPEAAGGRVILAHLGSGVSLAAVHQGRSIDTTMGLTPASGVPMSTRSGDIDPGLELYLARSEGLDAEGFNYLINFESGLLGMSETSADMEQLLEHEADDERAREAVELFCYQVKKSIGGLAAALGGLDTLVFTGGMGEAAPKIRARVCAGLEFIGVEVDAARNVAGAGVISPDASRVVVRVIPADEAVTMAREVSQTISGRRPQ